MVAGDASGRRRLAVAALGPPAERLPQVLDALVAAAVLEELPDLRLGKACGGGGVDMVVPWREGVGCGARGR